MVQKGRGHFMVKKDKVGSTFGREMTAIAGGGTVMMGAALI
jgi:hypothetical protein